MTTTVALIGLHFLSYSDTFNVNIQRLMPVKGQKIPVVGDRIYCTIFSWTRTYLFILGFLVKNIESSYVLIPYVTKLP